MTHQTQAGLRLTAWKMPWNITQMMSKIFNHMYFSGPVTILIFLKLSSVLVYNWYPVYFAFYKKSDNELVEPYHGITNLKPILNKK